MSAKTKYFMEEFASVSEIKTHQPTFVHLHIKVSW